MTRGHECQDGNHLTGTQGPGGWRGPWADPDDHAELRALGEAIEPRLTLRVQELGRQWRLEDPGQAVADSRTRVYQQLLRFLPVSRMSTRQKSP